MSVFSEIPGATCILRSGGVYRQTTCYSYDNRLFVKYRSGFVALHREGQTSAPKITFESLEGVEISTFKGKSSLYLKDLSNGSSS